MSDLTKFNLRDNKFSVTVESERLSIDDWDFIVVIFSHDLQQAFAHRASSKDYGKAVNFAKKVFERNVVDLTLWDRGTDFLEYTQKSDIEERIKEFSSDLFIQKELLCWFVEEDGADMEYEQLESARYAEALAERAAELAERDAALGLY